MIGAQHSLYVGFTKAYLRPGFEEGATGPVEYEGTLSEDGRFLTGTWQIRLPTRGRRTVRLHGAWEAHRLWSEIAEVEARPEGASAFREAVAARGAATVTNRAKTTVK